MEGKVNKMAKDLQAAFLEAMNQLKEYAKSNGGVVERQDVENYFKDMSLDDDRFQMITGYLLANNIKVLGEDDDDNEFLKMLESASGGRTDLKEQESDSGTADSLITEEDGIITSVKLSEDEVKTLPEREIQMTAQLIADSLDYDADESFLENYKKDLNRISPLSDTTRAYLLLNIVEDNDKESLRVLSESFLEKILQWIEPFRNKGVLACDLIQEGSLAMMGYVSEKQWMNNSEWEKKIKEGTTQDVAEVLCGIDNEVKELVEGSLQMLIDEQADSNKVAGKVLNKVNFVNDWAVRLREELGRKPTVTELAQRMGVSEEIINEAIVLSAEKIDNVETVQSRNT